MQTSRSLLAGALFRASTQMIQRKLLLALTVAFLSAPVYAQDRVGTTYEVFGGGSYGRVSNTTSENAFGWEASISQYPYTSHPWIGGEIEASGLYSNEIVEEGTATFYQSLYAYMAGPTFAARARGRVRPTAHVLIGAVNVRSRAEGLLVSTSGTAGRTNKTIFGSALGGGFDVALPYRLTARGVADWLSFSESASNRNNDLRVSAGIVFKF